LIKPKKRASASLTKNLQRSHKVGVSQRARKRSQ
jgi:hypothetical protein